MICEDCGVSMQWRCTDNITKVSKFKCPNCGHVQMGKLDMKPIVEHNNPKYYHEKNGAWIVKRTINHKYLYVGSFANEETAKRVVQKMEEVDWDKSMIPSVFSSLGIHKVNRSWVCV